MENRMKGTPSIDLGHDVASGSWFDTPVLAVSQGSARGNLAPGVPLEPVAPHRPPTSRHAARGGQPALRIGPGGVTDPVVPLVLRGGIDHAGDMSAGAEHERRVAGEKLGRSVGRLPGDDVV